MFVIKKSSAAVVNVVRGFVSEIINLNWNDHVLAEMGAVKSANDRRGAADSEI